MENITCVHHRYASLNKRGVASYACVICFFIKTQSWDDRLHTYQKDLYDLFHLFTHFCKSDCATSLNMKDEDGEVVETLCSFPGCPATGSRSVPSGFCEVDIVLTPGTACTWPSTSTTCRRCTTTLA
jgi:hypothetical protein